MEFFHGKCQLVRNDIESEFLLSRLLLGPDLMAFTSIILRPDPIPSRSHDSIGIQSILQAFIESHDGLKLPSLENGEYVVVPIVGSSDLILQDKMSSVLSISHGLRFGNQLPHTSESIPLTLRITLVENDHCDMMHFTPSNTKSGQDIKSVFSADALTEGELSLGIHTADRRNRTEGDVRAVGEPVHPIEFAEIGSAAVNVDSRSQVGIFWRVLWEEELLSANAQMNRILLHP